MVPNYNLVVLLFSFVTSAITLYKTLVKYIVVAYNVYG